MGRNPSILINSDFSNVACYKKFETQFLKFEYLTQFIKVDADKKKTFRRKLVLLDKS